MKCIILIFSFALIVGATVLLAGDAFVPAATQASREVSFAKAITIESPLLYPYSMAAGDLVHGGIPGLAVVSEDNDVPLVYALGNGYGRFERWRQDDKAGYIAGFVLLADVDGDGNLDAITTDAGGGDLNVSFGDGKGHFNGGKRLLVDGAYGTYIATVADLNGDGIPDIVGTDSNGVFVILGKGSREFAKAVTFSSGGQNPNGIAFGDLRHNGVLDLVVANAFSSVGYGNVAVLLGKGDGTFEKPVLYQAGMRPWQLVLGSFSKNGHLDVAVASPDSPYVNTIKVLPGKGDGTFGAARDYRSGLYPISIVSADFNGGRSPGPSGREL
jgi:hypothetical protein